MERKEVKSGNIRSVGFDEKESTLEVEFFNGALYRYHGVTKELHAELIAATSIGKFLNQKIKPYLKCVRVNPVAEKAREVKPSENQALQNPPEVK